MTDPTTPTGQRLGPEVREVLIHGVEDRWTRGYGIVWHIERSIARIEVEAAAQERASLLEEHCAGHDDTDGPCETCELLEAKR